jgi:hypothetical protein
MTVRRRQVFYLLGVVGVFVLIASFFALIAGLVDWDWNLFSPLRVRSRGIDVMFSQAWHYLLPTTALLLTSFVAALTGGVWLVRNPAPRDAPF